MAAGTSRGARRSRGPRAHPRLLASVALVTVLMAGCTGGAGVEPFPTVRPTATSQTEGSGEPPLASEPPRPSGSPTASPSRSATPTQSPTAPPTTGTLEAFTRDCRGNAEFRAGYVRYPGSLSIPLGGTANYSAAVDVREVQGDPEEVIDHKNPKGSPVFVQCLLGARLVGVGGGITVESTTADLDGGWRYYEFTPAGVVEWSWSVSPRQPIDQQLRLELRPAVKDIRAGALSELAASADYVTAVDVQATRIQRLDFWMDTEGKTLGTILGGLGAAVLAALAFSSKFREAVRGLFGRKSPAPTEGSATRPRAGRRRKR